MAYTTIDDGSAHFQTVIWSGDGSSTRSITHSGNSNLQPDWTWHKVRSHAASHMLYDSTRGVGKRLHSDQSSAEATETNSGTITSFDSNGFSVNTGASNNFYTNQSGKTYVAWQWKAGGSTPTKTYKVVVVSDSGNKYRFRNSGDTATYAASAVTLDLQEGGTYIFDQSDSSNSGHPLRFSTTSNGTHGGGSEYTTGVTTSGTAGNAGAFTQITVAASAPTLYYYCTQHSAMGGQVNTNSTHGQTNFDGSILSVSQANTTAGFSIVTYTGNATAGQTVGHGLGVKPEIIFAKNRSNGNNWNVYAEPVDNTGNNYLSLNGTVGKESDFNMWNDTAPTTSLITLGNRNETNGSSHNMVFYCFHSVKGYSKIGSYTGNGNADGAFIYTGFAPAWLMVKRSDGSNDWVIFDNKRTPSNVIRKYLYANSSTQEDSASAGFSNMVDFLSNGFKLRNTFNNSNGSGVSVIFMAFAEHPFVSSKGVPTTAR